jgi:histidine ammonia-lyase
MAIDMVNHMVSDMVIVPGELSLEQLRAVHTNVLQLSISNEARPAIRKSALVVREAAKSNFQSYN